MSLKIKQKDKIVPKIQIQTSELDAQKTANQYKKLEAELKAIQVDPAIKKKQDKLASLRKQILDHVNETVEDEESVTFITKHGDMKIGKRGTSRTITDKEKAIEFMTLETFIKLSEPKLSDLDKYLTPEEVAQVTVTKVTNTRRIT